MFEASLDKYKAAQQRHPAHPAEIAADIVDEYGWLADIARLQGNYAEALVDRNIQRQMLEADLARDPTDVQPPTQCHRVLIRIQP